MDPNFRLDVFPPEKKKAVKDKLKNLVRAVSQLDSKSVLDSTEDTPSRAEKKRAQNYIYYKQDVEHEEKQDAIDLMLEEFIRKTSESKPQCALAFWKKNESSFPILARLAKKYLSVQASSAAVERMFSICGHIFSCKRRRLGILFFVNLVLLKLNEQFID